jgi:hypothetical protein
MSFDAGESEETRKQRFDEFRQLCHETGAAFFAWQNVEKAHFKLFLRMLGAPQWEVAAAAYYSIESFALRHTLVGRMAHYFMQDNRYKKHRERWCGVDGGLQKEIKAANENRNKLAHYDLDWTRSKITEEPDGGVTVVFEEPALQPVDTNLVARLLGWTSDKPEHNLTIDSVRQYSRSFYDLGKRLHDFQESLNLPAPQLGLAALLAGARPWSPLDPPLPFPSKPRPKDDPSSAE